MDEKLKKAIFNQTAWYRIAQPNEKPDGYILVEGKDGNFVDQVDIVFEDKAIFSEYQSSIWEYGKYELVIFDEDGCRYSATVEVKE